VAILVTVSAEQYFNGLARGIPSAEPVTSVGQWGVWAATGVVLCATLINGFAVMTGMRPEESEKVTYGPKQSQLSAA
jgi:hypothetical protein